MKRGGSGVLYGTTAFVSSAMLLVLEIVAGRLLAPYVGVSLYTWTAIIGVILAGLSVGNWIGGVLAEKGFGDKAVGLLLVAAAACSALILPLLAWIAVRIQGTEIGLANASMLYVTWLFLIPALIIGAITPLITTLYLGVDERTGRIVGRMHALAAVGSIVGTFATGLFLVQWIGTRNIILLVSLVLFVLALPFLFRARSRYMASGIGAAVYLGALLGSLNSIGYVSPCTVESNYYCLRVVDENDGGGALRARTLVLDHMIHSTNVARDPGALVTPYIQVMDRLIDRHFADRNTLSYFFAGGGAYTHPRAIQFRFPGASITVSEIDPAVTKLAESALFVTRGDMSIVHGDTRNVLKRYADSEFDVLVTDVFHDVAIPWHLATLEHAELIKTKLTGNGLYLANVIDYFPESKLVLSMVATLKQVFPFVGVWVDPPATGSSRLTYVISASERVVEGDRLSIGFASPTTGQISNPSLDQSATSWFQIADFIEQQIEKYDTPLLTDDFAPVERLLGPLLTSPAGT